MLSSSANLLGWQGYHGEVFLLLLTSELVVHKPRKLPFFALHLLHELINSLQVVHELLLLFDILPRPLQDEEVVPAALLFEQNVKLGAL